MKEKELRRERKVRKGGEKKSSPESRGEELQWFLQSIKRPQRAKQLLLLSAAQTPEH